ncbi:MAG: FecR domain-containing protein [Beijerinckiaceae bacterium]
MSETTRSAKPRLGGQPTRRAIIALAAGAPVLGAGETRAQTAAGKVSNVRGMAFAEVGPGTRTLIQAEAVYLDELLRTGDDSRLGVALSNGNQIDLGARSKLRIDRTLLDGGGSLTLGGGAMMLDRPDAGRKGRLNVTSPFAVIAVRGTKFFAGEIDGFGVFVERGAVQVSAAGRSVIVRAGEGTTIPRVGAPPEDVRVWGAPKIARARAMIA